MVLRTFGRGTSTVAECDKQATVVGLLLTMTTPGDDGVCGHVLSTVDRRPLSVDHTQCTARWTTFGGDAQRRAGQSASADT